MFTSIYLFIFINVHGCALLVSLFEINSKSYPDLSVFSHGVGTLLCLCKNDVVFYPITVPF